MKTRAILVMAAVTALAGCGSHQQAALPEAPPQRYGSLSIELKIPSAQTATTAARARKYVSPGTQSVQINMAPGPTFSANVTPNSPNCTATQSATLCRWDNIGAPAGNDEINVNAFDQPLTSGGSTQGNLLSAGTTTVAINEGQSNTAQITMGGVAAKAQIVSLNAAPVNGVQTDLQVSVKIMDADGYTIVGNAPYTMYDGWNHDPVGIGIQTTPVDGESDFLYSVDGATLSNQTGVSLTTPADTYSIAYKGRGVMSATLSVGKTNGGPLATAAITPKAAIVPISGAPAIEPGAKFIVQDQHTMWFTEPSKHAFAYLTDGVLHEIVLPSGHTPTQFNVSTFGNYVFATQEGTIGTVSTSVLNEYTLPVTTRIGGISQDLQTAGLVFTEPDAGKVASYVMDGIHPAYYTEYPLAAGADPETMADGYWVDPGTNSIGSLSVLSGTVTEIPLPTANSKPSAISWGPGSTLWIAEAGASRVARYNPNTGSILEFTTAGVLTSLATADEEFLLAATDAAGNIEYFDNTGKETTFVTGSAGPATQISGGIDDFPYLCPTCSVGIQDFLF